VVVVCEVVVKPEDCGNSTAGKPNLATISARVVLSISIHLTSSGSIRLLSSAVAHAKTTKARTVSTVAKAGAYEARCGYGGRVPLLAISPLAKRNYVDHTVTDQSSILRFIEDNWFLGRIGNQSFDALAGSLEGLFQFNQVNQGQNVSPLILDPATGRPTGDQN